MAAQPCPAARPDQALVGVAGGSHSPAGTEDLKSRCIYEQ